MNKNPIKNLAASVHQRLLNLDPQRSHDFTPVLRRYAFERWLYRLGKSDYAERFIMKGAMLFALWIRETPRTTRDLDLLGFGDLSADSIRTAFSKIGRMEVEPDGLSFDDKNMTVEPIRDETGYQGHSVKFAAHMSNIRIPLQVDIGIGDAVWPEPEYVIYPTLLDMPAPRIKAYRRETSIAEKLEAIIELGALNSRMKDFYDIVILADRFSFKGEDLKKAILETFKGRKASPPSGLPVAFTEDFALDKDKNNQWKAFLRRIGKDGRSMPFPQFLLRMKTFLFPVLQAISDNRDFRTVWEPGGPWKEKGGSDGNL
jgi:predicted nucleotidyltransferase component of viral defense system